MTDNILNAKQFVTNGQTALVLFTRGSHFEISNDQSGSTGHWKIAPDLDCDKVIVYLRKSDRNEVYIADFVGTRQAPEVGRQIVLFRNIKNAGITSSNWYEFANARQRPVRIVK